jgi:TetR/AcrR family transcriptional regulator
MGDGMPQIPKDKREARALATKTAIIDAAEELFVKKGFAATSISEVASKAKVTKSLIHHHFGSKEALWQAVEAKYHDRMESYLRRVVEEAESSWRTEFFEKSIPDYFEHIEQNRTIFHLDIWLKAEQREHVSFAQPQIQQIIERIKRAQEDGDLRSDIQPCLMLAALWGMVESWLPSKLNYEARMGRSLRGEQVNQEYTDAVVKIFLEGIKPRD